MSKLIEVHSHYTKMQFNYQFVINRYGTAQLSLKAYIQPIVNLLGDPTATVRDAAIQTLVEIYKHVGE